ncbi:MAG: ribonuclease PH [Neisseriaceae bacterium]|nr:MAG: ribonuclease PH [Neisseriaceae bacterium]
MLYRKDRLVNAIRSAKITPDYLIYPEGSVLIEMGQTKVICNATYEEKVPPFLKWKNTGWVTAEYGMLPRSTETRMRREASVGKQSGRTQEIQRLISRSLRQAIELELLGERQITIDCDVIQADGGTRTASITGAYVALHLAILKLLKRNILSKNPLLEPIAAISVGVVEGVSLLDLDYTEDSHCDSDINIVMNHSGKIIEIQGTAERAGFDSDQLLELMSYAKPGIHMLFELQREAIEKSKVFQS